MTNKPLYTVPGVYRDGCDIIFAAADRQKQGMTLLLVDPANGETVEEIPMTPSDRRGSLLTASVKCEREPIAYLFRSAGRIITDPYARMIKNGLCYVPPKEKAVSRTEPAGPRIEKTSDLVIYRLHVRGLTMTDSRFDEREAGTFSALSRRIQSISRTGFNAVELMPAYDFDDTLKDSTKKNYWGYAETNRYFAPNPRYAATDDPVGEFRDLVRQCHKCGTAVIMEFFFPSGCDPFIGWQALRYWKEAYDVDGFRIIGEGMPHDVLLADPYLADRCLIFERSSEELLSRFRQRLQSGVLFENDDFRMTARAFLKGDGGQTSLFVHKTLRSTTWWTPVNDMADSNGFTLFDAVSYENKHNEANGENNRDGSDHNVTWNGGAEGPTKNRRIIELRQRQIRNALAYVFLAQGVPLVNAGDESGNTQGGNNNAYCCDDPTGWVDPVRTAFSKSLRSYVRDLADLRRRYPVLRTGRPLREISESAKGFPEVSVHGDKAWFFDFAYERRAFGILYSGKPDSFLYVIYNSSPDAEVIALPDLPSGCGWQKIMDTGRAARPVFPDAPEAIDKTKTIEAAPRTVTVLRAAKLTDD